MKELIMTNHSHVVAQLAAQYPNEWRTAHTGGSGTEDFIRLLAAHLHAIDANVGLNGKRGNEDDISDDALAVFDASGDVTDRTGRRMHVVDCIIGAGGLNPTPGWSSVGGPSPGAWVQPSAATPAPGPGPTPIPGSGWEAKHRELLARFPAQPAASRDFVKKVAEQFAFSFPGEGWGCKSAAPNRPQSDNVVARQTSGGLVGYQIVGAFATINLVGQHFLPVTPANHLGVVGPGPSPTPTPQPGPIAPVPLPDRGEMMAAIDWLHDYYKSDAGLQRAKGLWKNDRPDAEGIGAWILDAYIAQRQAGKTDTQAKGEIVRQIELSDEWKSKHASLPPAA